MINLQQKLGTIKLSEIILTIDGVDLLELYGENDTKLNLLRKTFPNIKVISRGNTLKLAGDKQSTQRCKAKVELMVRNLKKHHTLSVQDIQEILNGNNPFENKLSQNGHSNTTILYRRNGSPIKAKTKNQRLLVESSEANDVVFAIGPAGYW